jgi:hypothetical protein
LANTAAFLDLTSSDGMKHFKGATEALNSQAFDFREDSDLQVFLDLILTKSQVWGWNPIFNIPVTDPITAAVTNWNLLTHFGVIPLDAVRAHAMSCHATPSKRAQDSFVLCQCLLNSLTLDFLKTITQDSALCHMPATVAVNGDVPAGVVLLKTIISRAHVDSRATASFIRTSLTKLDEKMIELDSNMLESNACVKAQVNALSQRGQTTDDLLINLFKGHKMAKDVEFQDLIRRKSNHHDEGGDVNVDNLMIDTDMKHRAKKLFMKWSAPTEEQEQITALTARAEKLTARVEKLKAVPKKPAATGTAPKKPRKDNKWAWKDVPPKAGEPRTKHFEGKDCHVACPCHPDQWVCHPASECSKNPAVIAAAAATAAAAAQTATTPSNRRLQRAQLAASLLEEGDEDSDEDEVDPP